MVDVICRVIGEWSEEMKLVCVPEIEERVELGHFDNELKTWSTKVYQVNGRIHGARQSGVTSSWMSQVILILIEVDKEPVSNEM